MKLKSNASMAAARVSQSFQKGLYKGLNMDKLPIREGSLDLLNKPSLFGGVPRPFKFALKKEKRDVD